MKIDEGSDQTSDIWPHWMASHARLKNEFTEDNKYHNLMTWLIHRVNRRLGVQSEVDKIKEDILKMEEEKNKCNKELRSLKEEASRIHVQNTLDEVSVKYVPLEPVS